jgi:hypothetical protein
MITGDESDIFIVWAYLGIAVATIALAAWAIWDARRVKLRLAALDRAGIRRRSAGMPD